MQRTSAVCLLALTLTLTAQHGGGVTKTPGTSGISQFWTDDYKVFEQIYGKTSDKEIYGANLPPSISYGIDATRLRSEAIDKKERFLDNDGQNSDIDDAYGFGNRYPYNTLLAKEAIKTLAITKPTKSPIKFISTDFNPISQSSDLETYNYLKKLEKLQKQNIEIPVISVGGFKPYLSYAGSNPEDTEAYKSIQDILDAHEANRGAKKENDDADGQVKYQTYPSKGRGISKKQKPRAPVNGKLKARCPLGRCRKRATNSYRVYTRPYVRKIKHKIVYE